MKRIMKMIMMKMENEEWWRKYVNEELIIMK